ncbi:MAG: hypothetical protein VKJ02_11140 [Snowella sp.]|nr:hypothetical protein [Snowella sp.]
MPKAKSDFTNFIDSRPNYFPGQFLLEDDFETEQKYFIERQKYHHQSLHVSGIIEGLEVEVIKDKQEVQIKSGSAINSNGDLIVLKHNLNFSKFGTLTNGELYISYGEEKQVEQQKDNKESCTRWQEKPTIVFAPTTPNDGVKLAKVSITDTVLKLDFSIRDYSGVFLPNATGNDLTLRSGGNANPNLAILNGSLTVTGTITGRINAVNINSENLTVTNVLKIGQDASGGTRAWMTRGMSILWDSDNLFIGLKDEGSNRKDPVIAWEDDPQDDLRFIHVPSGEAANGTEIMRLKPSGNVGIGTTTPSEKLEISGNLKVTGSLTADNRIIAGGSDIYFTQTDHTHTAFGNTTGYAAIENASSHNALMILGRAGTPEGRCVKLWDYLEVNGNLKVTGTITGKIDAVNINSGVLDVARIPISAIIITGMIVMWSGDETRIPSGWALCDGQGGRPDLRGRFILGSGQGSGLTNRTRGGTGGVERHTLTVAEMPTHNHGITDPGHAHTWTASRQLQGTDDRNYTSELSKGDAGSGDDMSKNTNSVTTGISIQNNGSSQSHENMPPFYVLAFIIKL